MLRHGPEVTVIINKIGVPLRMIASIVNWVFVYGASIKWNHNAFKVEYVVGFRNKSVFLAIELETLRGHPFLLRPGFDQQFVPKPRRQPHRHGAPNQKAKVICPE